jgi:ferrous iron transport protein B
MHKIGLIGNPNSGKSSVFNELTGLRHKVGNYPGVTVEISTGTFMVEGRKVAQLIDFPGAYSLHSNTSDEFLLTRALLDDRRPEHPQTLLYVADALLLEKQLLLLTQIIDLGFPVVVCLTNCDQLDPGEVEDRVELVREKLGVRVVPVSTKTGWNVGQLKLELQQIALGDHPLPRQAHSLSLPDPGIEAECQKAGFANAYLYFLWKHYGPRLDPSRIQEAYLHRESIRLQIEETMQRHAWIESWTEPLRQLKNRSHLLTARIDQWLSRPWIGVPLFVVAMFLVFQAIFSWATLPMDLIEGGFAGLQSLLGEWLPAGWATELLVKGVVPGLSGVMVFIPQIALLFFLIGWMEELGYMARVVYLFDHLLRKFGLNGRSLVGLISGGACAIPAILSTRSINNKRDRLVTMFVIPLIPCSARIPVYAALIGFVVPYREMGGIFNSQGMAFMALYTLGIAVALLTAAVIRFFVKSDDLSYLVLQLPDYRWPSLKNVLLVAFDKVRSFVAEAGVIILLISIVLWFLASFSWKGELQAAEQEVRERAKVEGQSEAWTDHHVESAKLERSFAGKIGRTIEPVFEPLGFDWKISIALITSFAAREVFIGTMSTIYSLGSSENEMLLRQKMEQELRPDGSPRYDRRTSASLILFYAFAMQCMSTFAVMWKETRTRRWPVIQFIYMGLLAYLASWLAFHLL